MRNKSKEVLCGCFEFAGLDMENLNYGLIHGRLVQLEKKHLQIEIYNIISDYKDEISEAAMKQKHDSKNAILYTFGVIENKLEGKYL